MQEIRRFVIPVKNVRSLCWQQDTLVDWVGGGDQYNLDGTTHRAYINWAYRFDRAIVSPGGLIQVLYEAGGTKGIVLKDGKFVREINRSFYHAHVYEYPVALLVLPNGRVALVHCPEEYNKLEIEDAESGERLTGRKSEPIDFFHSRFSVSGDGKYLMSAGWIWHPLDAVMIYDVAQILAKPECLDRETDWDLVASMTEIHDAAFAKNDTAIFASADVYKEENEEEEERSDSLLRPDQLGHYSLSEKRFLTIASIEEPLGTLMPTGDYVVGFYEHPKLMEVATGKIVARWPDLKTGSQNSSINNRLDKVPPLALDSANGRFAVAGADQITIIQLG